MSIPASLFFTNSLYKVGGIAFDLLLSEDHSLSSTVSERSIENGSVISDHVQKQLREGSLTGLVSNYSVNQYIPELPLALQAKIATRRKVSAADVEIADRPTNRALDAYQLFKMLWENAEPVTISTTMETYENVVVTEISTGRNGDTGDALEFSVRFRQVRIVTLEQAIIETAIRPNKPGTSSTAKKDRAAKQASTKQDQGRGTTTTIQAPWETEGATTPSLFPSF